MALIQVSRSHSGQVNVIILTKSAFRLVKLEKWFCAVVMPTQPNVVAWFIAFTDIISNRK